MRKILMWSWNSLNKNLVKHGILEVFFSASKFIKRPLQESLACFSLGAAFLFCAYCGGQPSPPNVSGIKGDNYVGAEKEGSYPKATHMHRCGVRWAFPDRIAFSGKGADHSPRKYREWLEERAGWNFLEYLLRCGHGLSVSQGSGVEIWSSLSDLKRL